MFRGRLLRFGLVFWLLALPAAARAQQSLPDAYFADLEKRIPLYAAIREAAPDLYAQLRQILNQVNKAHNLDDFRQSGALPEMQRLMGSYIDAKVPHVQDDLVAAWFSDSTEKLKLVRSKDPAACGRAMLGEQFIDPVDFGLTDYALTHTYPLMERIVRAPKIESPQEMGDPEYAAVVQLSVVHAALQLNMTPQVVGGALLGNGDRALVCNANLAFNDQILKLPTQKIAAFYRTMVSVQGASGAPPNKL